MLTAPLGVLLVICYIFLGYVLVKIMRPISHYTLMLKSQLIFSINNFIGSLFVAVFVMMAVVSFLSTEVTMAIGFVTWVLSAKLIHKLSHSSNHPLIVYFVHLIYGIMDGIFIGCAIDYFILQKWFESVTLDQKITIFTLCCLATVRLSFAARHHDFDDEFYVN